MEVGNKQDYHKRPRDRQRVLLHRAPFGVRTAQNSRNRERSELLRGRDPQVPFHRLHSLLRGRLRCGKGNRIRPEGQHPDQRKMRPPSKRSAVEMRGDSGAPLGARFLVKNQSAEELLRREIDKLQNHPPIGTDTSARSA